MTIEWIKLTLSGMNMSPFGLYPCVHGRIEELPEDLRVGGETKLTEEGLNLVMTQGQCFKLYDPILITPRQTPEGGIQMGATALCENSMPPLDNEYIWINPVNVTVWTPFEVTKDWENLVASSIHGIEIAESGDIPDDYPGPRIVQP